jgi:hypothetical protein
MFCVATVPCSLQSGSGFDIMYDMAQIPGVWLSAEHQVVAWCNQLISAIAHLLLHAAAASRTDQQPPVSMKCILLASLQHQWGLQNAASGHFGEQCDSALISTARDSSLEKCTPLPSVALQHHDNSALNVSGDVVLDITADHPKCAPPRLSCLTCSDSNSVVCVLEKECRQHMRGKYKS